MFSQCLALQKDVLPMMKGVKDLNEAKDILVKSYSETMEKEKWAAFGITNDKFVDLTVDFVKVLCLQVMAEGAMAELKTRTYGQLAKEMKVYLRNLSACYADYLKGRERFCKENINGIISQMDTISDQFRPYVLDLRKAILGQVVFQKIKHAELMVYAILAEKLAAVASQYTADLLRNKLYDYPEGMVRMCRGLDFHNMAKMAKTIRRRLEFYCGQVNFSHAIRINVTLKTLTTKIDNIKRDGNGKYITV